MSDGLFRVCLALLITMAVGSLVILSFGQSPAKVYGVLWASTWGDAYGIGQTLFKSTPLILTGLSVSVAFRTGLFNIGCEGQLAMGGAACSLVAGAAPFGASPFLGACLAILVAAIAGGFWGLVPGVLRAYTGAHEVITTIMLNFIASALILWAGNEFFFVKGTTHFAATELSVPSLGIVGSAANVSFVMALVLAFVVWFLMKHTRLGFVFRTIASSMPAARTAGMNVERSIVGAMAFSGVLAGLVGVNYVLGHQGYYEDGMARGMGFMGIAVALLGGNHPAGIVAAALLMGTLAHGGLEVNQLVPKEFVEVLQVVIILVVAASSTYKRRGDD